MPAISRRRALVAAAGLATLGLGAAKQVTAWQSQVAEDAPPSIGTAQETLRFSEVEQVEPWDGLLFLSGKHPRYPGASLESIMGFSPAAILETMDTVVLDSIEARLGSSTLVRVYRLIAEQILESVLEVYGDAPVLLALDAGHGGKRGVYFDPGSNGTEYIHARQVVASLEERVSEPRYASITTRRVFNDDIGDDFLLPPPEDRKGAAALSMRNIRGAMLAYEVAAWNRANPQAQVLLHVLSVHFNAGSGGTLVLHQGDAVPEEHRTWSMAHAQAYVASARTALNNSGLMPYALGLPLGNGLSDDRVLYEPMMRLPSRINPYTGRDRGTFPRRYAMLQASLLQRDYVDGAMRYHGLV
jgi:hypothetical protein